MITTTLGRLVNAVPALQALSKHPLGMKPAYQLAKLTRLVDAETTIFQERVEALRKELGTDREATPAERASGAPATVRVIPPEQRDVFQTRLNDLVAVEVTIPWTPFDLSALGAATVTAEDLNLLGVGEPWALATLPDEVTSPAETPGEKSI